MRRSLTIPGLTLMVGLAFGAAAAVGGTATPASAGAAGGTVLAGSPQSQQPWDDTAGDDAWVLTARDDAHALLGAPEGELGAEVRISRRGAETMMLTEDYVLGRMTVELDDAGDGYRVTSVTVELPDGPETVHA